MIDTTGKDIHQVAEEIFKLLVEQGERCISEDGSSCLYGNDKGQHCAVGFLLPEENGALMGFDEGVFDLADMGDIGGNSTFIKNNKKELDVMQFMHDTKIKNTRLMQSKTLRDVYEIRNKYIDQWVEMGV